MVSKDELRSLGGRLVRTAYPEFRESEVAVSYGRTSAFASVTWRDRDESIEIVCNDDVKEWPEAAVLGLLAHELSHPAQESSNASEEGTDLDVLRRGLGLYLAVERLHASKYEDHLVRKGRDRYIGYRTIRKSLSQTESNQLDRLLSDLRLIPGKGPAVKKRVHDMVRRTSEKKTILLVDGYELTLDDTASCASIELSQAGPDLVITVDGARVLTLDDGFDG